MTATRRPVVGSSGVLSHSNRFDALVIDFEMLCQVLAHDHGAGLGEDQIFLRFTSDSGVGCHHNQVICLALEQ